MTKRRTKFPGIRSFWKGVMLLLVTGVQIGLTGDEKSPHRKALEEAKRKKEQQAERTKKQQAEEKRKKKQKDKRKKEHKVKATGESEGAQLIEIQQSDSSSNSS